MRATRPAAPFAAVGPGPLVVAHRGGSLEAPENTLASVAHGARVGSDWQEIDVTLSADGEPVVIHDDRLERTTTGHGLVAAKPWRELRLLGAGRPAWDPADRAAVGAAGGTVVDFGATWRGQTVPHLDEVLALPGTRLMIELKGGAGAERLPARVVAAVQRAAAADRVALGSFDARLVEAAHTADPTLPLIGILDDLAQVEPMCRLPVVALAVDKALLPQALVAAPPGVAVWVWTVYSVAEAAELAAVGAHGLITDVPQAVLRSLRPEPDGGPP